MPYCAHRYKIGLSQIEEHKITQKEDFAMYDHTNYSEVKESTLNALDSWGKKGWAGGGFVMSCLENNLKLAVSRADGENVKALPEIVTYMYNELPCGCWGSPEIVSQWLHKKEEE